MFSGSILSMRVNLRRFTVREAKRLKLKLKQAYSSAAPETGNSGSLLEHWHVDKGFWQGSGILAVLLAVGYLVPTDKQASILVSTVKTFRSLGVKPENISDTALMNDSFRRNLLAFYNVMLASPSFYFLWHLVHNAGFVTSSVRSITGTVRIVPFLAVLYGAWALFLPVATNFLMERGYDYKDASFKASAGALFSVMAVLEALAELRGCGVTFDQMNAPALTAFSFALIGRLATGVLVQQQKVGKEFKNSMPAEWKSDPGFKGKLYKMGDLMRIDNDFYFTLFGTSIFQHFLNSITYCLLTKGHATRMLDIGKYVTGGLNGTPSSAVQQFGRTVALRIGFVGCWNWLASQTPPEFAAVGVASKILEDENKAKASKK